MDDCVGEYDPCGTCNGDGNCKPSIYEIVDVPEDQGGRVYLSFYASTADTDSLRSEMYTVERRDNNIWVSVMSTTAYGLSAYTCEVPTLINHTDDQDGTTTFRVIASMDEGNFASDLYEGFSTDDLAPSVPGNFEAELLDDYVAQLSWSPVDDNDFSYYSIYRSQEEGFDPSLIEPIANISDLNIFIDLTLEEGNDYYYVISATDVNENESLYSDYVSITPLSTLDELVFSLNPSYPNPFNPTTNISYDISNISNVNLSIYNSAGQLVEVLVDKLQNPGSYNLVWDAKNHTSGIYFIKLTSGKDLSTQKIMLIK